MTRLAELAAKKTADLTLAEKLDLCKLMFITEQAKRLCGQQAQLPLNQALYPEKQP